MSLRIRNLTDFPNLRFVNSDNKGRDFGVFMVKGAFDIGDDGIALQSEEQEPFCFTDAYYGALNISSLKMPSDLVGYKPKADLIFKGTAYSPDGKPGKSWLVGIRVRDEQGIRLEKKLKIYGPRWWIPKWKRQLTDDEKINWKSYKDLFIGWELSEPEPIEQLPIRYEYAFGGTLAKGMDKANNQELVEAYEYNPVGCGWIDPEWTDHTKPVPAPQIEDPDIPISDPYKQYKPAGYGAIPPVWLPRRPLGGTFDADWQKNTWPDWPSDYDFAYNNSAAEGLKGNLFLSEDLEIDLVNLQPSQRIRTIKLSNPVPTISLGIKYDWTTFILNLDTIYIDGDDERIFCVWRGVFEQYKYESLILRLARQHYHSRYSLFKEIFITGTKPEDVALEANYE